MAYETETCERGVARVVLQVKSDGVYVFGIDSDGRCRFDWHQDDLAMAKRCAQEELGVPADAEWREVSEPTW